MIRPPALCEGDRIAVVAPASPFSREEFYRGLEELRTFGLEPVFNESVFEKSDYVAGRASHRAKSFLEMWRDPSIAGVIAVRGGYGSAQLLPFLDTNDFQSTPKVLIGCSDITSLLSFASIQCGMTVFHGPMIVTLGKGERLYDRSSLIGQIMSGAAYGSLICDGVEILKSGSSQGPIYGGTLTQIVASLGTPFSFKPPDKYVLLLDDVDERPYRVDRMMNQLRQAGLLERASALVCSEFQGCAESEGELSARSVLARYSSDINGPVLFGLRTGHTTFPMVTVPLGVKVTIQANSSVDVVIEEPAVQA